MEEKSIWDGKWKYGLMVVCLVAAVGVFAYAKISSSATKLQQKSEQAAALPAVQPAVSVPAQSSVDTSLGSAVAEASASGTVSSGAVVASKNGTKYYPVSCKSKSIIKEDNKVTFGSAAEAEAGGLYHC